MKAVQFTEIGEPDVLQYVDIPAPEPGEGEVRIKVDTISVNFADTLLRRGLYSRITNLPVVPGLEAAGVIDAVGPGVETFEAGQPVLAFTAAAYAEYVVAPARMVVRLPITLDLGKAAAFGITYMTAYHLLYTAGNIQSDHVVVVHSAAGGVGTALAQIGRRNHIRMIGLAGTDAKAAFAREQGMGDVLNYQTEDVVPRVLDMTDGRGANLVLDAVGGDWFGHNFEMLAPLGLIVLYGRAAGIPQLDLTATLMRNFAKGAGVQVFHILGSVFEPYPALMQESLKTVIEWLAAGDLEPVIHKVFPLEEAAQAHLLLESRQVLGKLLLKP